MSNEIYFELQGVVEKDVHAGRLEPGIALCEKTLGELPGTIFHAARRQTFLSQTEEAAEWLGNFYRQASEKMRVKTLYVEMTRFEINTDAWDAHAFAYDIFGDPEDLGWLCGWKMHTELPIMLQELSDIRASYRTHDGGSSTPDEERAACAVSMLVTLRFQELIWAAAVQARASGGIPENVPVMAAVHESEMVMVCYGRVKPRVTHKTARPKPVPIPDDGKVRVYSVEGGWDEFRNSLPWDVLDFESTELSMQMHKGLDQTGPLLESWKLLQMTLRRRKWRCDLVQAGAGRHWAVSRKAYDVLAPLLGQTVEFLPVNCEEWNPCWIMHPLHYVGLGPTGEHNAKGTANMTVVRKWAFRREDLAGLYLFGLQQAPRSSSRQAGIGFRSNLCTDRFRLAVEANDLSGVVFDELFACAAAE